MARKRRVVEEEEEEKKEEEVDREVVIENNPIIPPPTYVIERAKSGRAECKKCDDKIAHKELRVGVVMDGEWGLFTRWQHLNCTVFHKQMKSVQEIDGYNELPKEDKEIVKERFEKSKGEIDDEFVPINPDELVRKTWNQSIEPHPDLLMPLLPYQMEGLAWMVYQENTSVRGGILADEVREINIREII